MCRTGTVFLRFPTPYGFTSEGIILYCNYFFDAVSECLYRQFNGKTPAFISVLHTFGRDIKWNPHIHVLIAEGAADNFGNWHSKHYFSYESLRKSFQAILLKSMLAALGPGFKVVADKCYKSAVNGFFVYAPKSKGKIRNIINYLGRYLSRPPIATSRIDNYDGKNVTFHYKRHEDDLLITETIAAEEFIKRLVVHVPPHYFNMVRYYGLYAKPKTRLKKIGNILKAKNYRQSFSNLLLKTFGSDPHMCSVCGQKLVFAWLTHTPFNKIFINNSLSPPLTS
jgi:hypothetical protein